MAKTDTKSGTTRGSRPRRSATPITASRPTRRTASAKTETPYHHGALREALLQAAERVLERDGLGGLTLRAVAREAGVSHAAPTHHFGDLTGLLSELAAVGFRQFNAAMTASCDAATTPLEAALARPKAYVAYAQAHPGMYGIMFRSERLDYSRPSLHEAAEASFAGLANAIGMMRQEQISGDALTLNQGAAIARAWSMVHGFTMLLLDGRLEDILERLPEGTTAERLLEAMLTAPITSKPPGH
ncbi:TetR family transcriptional regulator [Bradyrhizobium sp. WBOS7]|uniref:TetR family transcriptional regulator n=1 Tax=Bradyrhizobium betae TaxID=244734 RepID=A0AAE9SX08_9BRAD|nr:MULTISPECIES: WHG domain-containing protein [Bradyrhizobium]MDD1569173.1 TetR family transcriptional regulator [Bradyrhizobium sp. WBOS1]UUO37976.1 TetR family transcriptional regulator [Bradyrhizobium sp. WBOS01]MDD1527052.1 TetR family transcriptional regulator [Bradyrhizobium sp. WBOS2]MDD1576292.1 TetR family transcriptional regulator [Bradyrhizobium sp. WBOS7]MDD1602546.1 TetR family transcriptional regulator [Bradyrhizobium sp. WBOS16]